jgi:hypothetical protein
VLQWNVEFTTGRARGTIWNDDYYGIGGSAYKVRSMLNSSCEKLVAVDKPKAWQNWHAQDWEETAMASLGCTKLEQLWIGTSCMISLALLASPLAILYPLLYIHPKAHDAAWAYVLWGIE